MLGDVATLTLEHEARQRRIAERGDLLQHELVFAVYPTVQSVAGLLYQLVRRVLSASEFGTATRKCGRDRAVVRSAVRLSA